MSGSDETFLLLLDRAKFSVLILRKGNKLPMTLQYQTQKKPFNS